MKSTMILPCGVSSAAKRACAGRDLADIGGHQPVEKSRGVVAGDLDDAAIGKKRSLHAILANRQFLARTRAKT